MKKEILNKNIKRTYHLENYKIEALRILSEKTRVKQVDYVREAIDDLILKYQEDLPKDLITYVKKNCIKLV